MAQRRTDEESGDRTGHEQVLDVVQEELDVGKRQVDRGGVRVTQRVSEKPVRELIQLREERAVDERVSAADAAPSRTPHGLRSGRAQKSGEPMVLPACPWDRQRFPLFCPPRSGLL